MSKKLHQDCITKEDNNYDENSVTQTRLRIRKYPEYVWPLEIYVKVVIQHCGLVFHGYIPDIRGLKIFNTFLSFASRLQVSNRCAAPIRHYAMYGVFLHC